MDRRQFLQAIAGSIVLNSLLPAIADEPKSAALMQTLPADGAWVTFNVNVKVNVQEFVMTGTARSGRRFMAASSADSLSTNRPSIPRQRSTFRSLAI